MYGICGREGNRPIGGGIDFGLSVGAALCGCLDKNSNAFGWLSRIPKAKAKAKENSNAFGWLSRIPIAKAKENSNAFGWLSRVTRTMWECFIIGTLRRGPTSLCEKIKRQFYK
jgi:hypothetical protein